MEITRISIDTLKGMIDKQEAVTILDVRQPAAYSGSNKKIKGSVYLDPNNEEGIKDFLKDRDKNALIVAYCS
ncbi:MAG: hypothetical protein LLF28_02335 [Nitrospiraceae bacterium]|nr:hypothetical protein [Nitrospiraceae bacterium]